MIVHIYGDFDNCVYSSSAKTTAEKWHSMNKQCTLKLVHVPIHDLRACKTGANSVNNFTNEMINLILKDNLNKTVHDITLPSVFVDGAFLGGYNDFVNFLSSLRSNQKSSKRTRSRSNQKSSKRTRSRSNQKSSKRMRSRSNQKSSKRMRSRSNQKSSKHNKKTR